MTEKTCTGCGETKPLTDFYFDSTSSKHKARCKPCHKHVCYCNPRNRASHMLQAARKRADKRGLEVSISIEWIEQKVRHGICEKTSLPFELTTGQGSGQNNPWAPSLDRIDPTKGYTRENTRCVVFMYNAAKHVAKDEDLRRMAEAIVGVSE